MKSKTTTFKLCNGRMSFKEKHLSLSLALSCKSFKVAGWGERVINSGLKNHKTGCFRTFYKLHQKHKLQARAACHKNFSRALLLFTRMTANTPTCSYNYLFKLFLWHGCVHHPRTRNVYKHLPSYSKYPEDLPLCTRLQ